MTWLDLITKQWCFEFGQLHGAWAVTVAKTFPREMGLTGVELRDLSHCLIMRVLCTRCIVCLDGMGMLLAFITRGALRMHITWVFASFHRHILELS